MIRQSGGHGWCTGIPPVLCFAQLVMWNAPIVGTADEIHARLDGRQTMSRMPTFAGEASQALPHRAIEAFNKGRVQFASSPACLKQLLCVRKRSQRHLASDLDDV